MAGFRFSLLSFAAFLLASPSDPTEVPRSHRAAGVFMLIQGGQYTFNSSAAAAACRLLNVTIATRAQVERAQRRGLETCKFGWIAEQIAVVLRVTAEKKCGRGSTGVVTWRAKLHQKFGVFCFNASDFMETPNSSTAGAQSSPLPTTVPLSPAPGGPSLPSAPGEPSLPSAPGGPSLPSAPGGPSLPSAPGEPSLPSAPGEPSLPSAPGGPSLPSAPGGPSLPSALGGPSLPSATRPPPSTAPTSTNAGEQTPPPSAITPLIETMRISTTSPPLKLSSTHIPTSPSQLRTSEPSAVALTFFTSAWTFSFSLSSPSATPRPASSATPSSGTATTGLFILGGSIIVVVVIAAVLLVRYHKLRRHVFPHWPRGPLRDDTETEMWKHGDGDTDLCGGGEGGEEESDGTFSSDITLCVNPAFRTNTSL